MKKKKLEVLKPVCIGCLWSDLGETLPRDPDWERLQQYTVCRPTSIKQWIVFKGSALYNGIVRHSLMIEYKKLKLLFKKEILKSLALILLLLLCVLHHLISKCSN